MTEHQLHATEMKPREVAWNTPPESLSEASKAAWAYVVHHAPPDVLHALDAAMLERWAKCAGRYREAAAQLNRAGIGALLIKTPSGEVQCSPLRNEIRALGQEMRGYETQMGFTPMARRRMSAHPAAHSEQTP